MNPDIIGMIQQAYAAGAQGSAIPGAQGAFLNPDTGMVGRLQIASGDQVTVKKASTARLTISVQAPFRPDFLVLQSNATGKSNVVVTSIKVGTAEQLVSKSSAIGLDTFAPGNLLGKVAFNTASPGVDITIELTNNSATTDEDVNVAAYGVRLERA